MKPHVMVNSMKNKKQILAGAVLLGTGVVIGLGLRGPADSKLPVVEVSPTSAKVIEMGKVKPIEKVKYVEAKPTTASVEQPKEERVLKNVSPEDLEIIRQIAAQRGESELPPQEWVDHVWPKIKKSMAAKSASVN